jgi:hypothetical protein
MSEGIRRKRGLWNKKGRTQLESLSLAPRTSRCRQELLELLDRVDPSIDQLSRAIEREAERVPEVQRSFGQASNPCPVISAGYKKASVADPRPQNCRARHKKTGAGPGGIPKIRPIAKVFYSWNVWLILTFCWELCWGFLNYCGSTR